MGEQLRIMSIMAHQDDFEMVAAGIFLLLRKSYGDDLKIKIVTTTRGASGHMDMDTDETFAIRDREARASAALIAAEYECLRQLDGSYVEGQVIINHNLLGGIWNVIRDFEPDVIFCPPVVTNPLSGIHIDHYNTATAVRMVAYQLIVPHAYPTMNGPIKKRFAPPLIVNVDDSYEGTSSYHICCDIFEVFDKKAEMILCHKSQIFEWLPFAEGRQPPVSEQEWKDGFFLTRHARMNNWHGKNNDVPREYFQITSWGRSASEESIKMIFPQNSERHPGLDKLLISSAIRSHYRKE